MTPTAFSCTQRCVFCWRAQNSDLGLEWNELATPDNDEPEQIVEASIQAQRRILSGYKANPKTDMKKLQEAQNPDQAAISLAGEPTMYERLGHLLRTFHKRRFTTFLVSNGTLPSALADLDEEPTQLYISACAPDKKTFTQVCRPQIPNAWKNLKETLSLLPSFKCPTVIRITLARGLNINNVRGYAKLIERANPTYVEPKAYMHVGFSRQRMGFENTPTHREIREFSSCLAKDIGYSLIGESEDSRVVLLSRLQKPILFQNGEISCK
jgi:tRNA wybutosine-synthesizing protein 1